MVAGIAKSYNLTPDYVLQMSFANISLYSSVLPSNDDITGKGETVINGDDPKNKDLIKDLLFG